MRYILRLALPPLRELGAATELPFALCDRQRRLVRAGALPLGRLAELPTARIEAVIAADDMVAAPVAVPPLRGPRLQAAVLGAVEPMVLGEVDALAVGHGPRDAATGRVDAAWMDRALFMAGWERLAAAGVNVSTWVPEAWLGEPAGALRDADDARWLRAAPAWTPQLDGLRPGAGAAARWKRAIGWSVAAAAVWVLGLNLYAGQRDREAAGLRADMRRQLLAAFPDTPVVVDPLRQAMQRRDQLRAGQGGQRDTDFLPLSLAAAQAYDIAQDKVLRVQYGAGVLRLTPQAGTPTPPAAQLARQGSAFGLTASVNGGDWIVQRAGAETQGAPR